MPNILSPHYFGVPALKPESGRQISSELVTPENNIVGRTFKAPTVGSYGHAAPILIQATDACGNPIWENRTANNVFRSYDVPINGYFSPQIDDGVIRNNVQFPTIAGWKAAGEESQTREEVVHPQKSVNYGFIESFGERQLKLPEGDTPVNLFVHNNWYSGQINQFGKYSHQARNLKQHLMEYYGLKGTQEFVSFLKSRGLSMKEIGYLASGFMPEGFVYSVRKSTDGKAILSAAEGSFEALAETARALGLDPKDMVAFGLDEEQIHIARATDISALAELIAEEIATKSIARDFYAKMARGSQGNPELSRKYGILAALKDEDIKTTRKVYTKIHTEYREDLEEMVEEAEKSQNSEGRHYTASADGKTVYMHAHGSKNTNSKKAGEGEKGKVIYGKFGKDYKGRSAETEGKDAKPDSRSDRDSSDAKDSGKAKGETAEPVQVEASAEAA